MADFSLLSDVIQYIQRDWSFMTDDNCIPVQVALQLMDSSSLGRAHQYDQFQQTHKQLQKALKAIVNEHHQGFNSSIGTFHLVQAGIQASQARVQALKESLSQAKSSLSTAKPELKALAGSSQSYDNMLQILSQIEDLQLIPEKLEARISEKRFLTAVEILQDALEMMRRPEVEGIGALSDLRVYLSNQESSVTDILIEELHSHLYLKSPYCQDRWRSYAQTEGKADTSDAGQASAGKPIYHFLENLDVSKPMVEDASRNPEADSFYYIQLLVESLNKMGHLDQAVDGVEQRLPIELFRVVDKTNSEVAQRHPNSIRGASRRAKEKAIFGLGGSESRMAIVSDLLWTLYSKFEAIAEGHRAVHEVISGIIKREGKENAAALTGGFKELWKLYQSEIRSLLHDYLATDGDMSFRDGQAQTVSGGLFQKSQRDKSKKMFKLSDIDHQSVEMSTEQEDLEFILKSSVPGLISDSRRTKGVVLNDNSQSDSSGTGHRLLVEPSVFNMGLLLPPSLSFIQRLKEIVPPGSDIVMSTLTSFLDDFLVNVFHPQLDETLADLSARAFMEADAFLQDSQWSKVARKPIFKGTSAFFSLITAFCEMLDTIPHDQAFSQLIITQMVSYHEKCLAWYRSLVTRVQSQADGGNRLRRAAAYAESGEIHDTIAKLWISEAGQQQELLDKENGLLILETNQTPLEPSDLISDRRTTVSLCLLYTSMKWLASKVGQLRHITTHQADSSRREGKTGRGRRWTLLAPSKRGGGSSVFLPMTQETVYAFDGVVSSYQDLAASVLLTLQVEARLQVIFNINASLRSNYVLEQAVNDPDPSILMLNAELVNFDEDVTAQLRESEHRFLTSGLGLLIDTLLVANASTLKAMNTPGCARMQLNILVLQQNLKNIEATQAHNQDVVLVRSARFFDFFADGPNAVLAAATEAAKGGGLPYSYDELAVVVELWYSEALASERREVAMLAKREMGDRLLGLSEVLWQS
ncbi:MAG: hypothetical protein M1832_005840 [Thelocarpon impressellum]|nr:MAG: hypothetical protein M1832_005840 [Thelocarpon impressellum]